MRNRTLLPIRLKDEYGDLGLSYFYPDIVPNPRITYRDVREMYEKCLSRKDVEAIQLLNKNFDLEKIFDFDCRFNSEEVAIGDYRRSDAVSRYNRKYYDGKGFKRRRGGRYYQSLFDIDKDGRYYFDIRKFYFSRSCQDVQKMFDLSKSEIRYEVDGITFPDMYDSFRNLPDLKVVILFYLRHIATYHIPILDYEELRDGIIEMK